MKKNSYLVLAIIFICFTFLSFKKPVHKAKTTDCFNYVTVYADGLTINLVQINGDIYHVTIPSGQNQSFYKPYYSQGTSITVHVNIYGQGAAPRMRSLGIENPFQCITYGGIGVTQGSITGIKQCATMIVHAANAPTCP